MNRSNYEYIESGIMWFGVIPKHWGVKKVKHIASFYTGWTPPSGNDEYYDGDYSWVNISDLGLKYLETPAKTITQEAVDTLRMKQSYKGSLLFSFKLSIGLVSLLEKDVYTNEAIATFPPNERINTQFLYYLAPVAIPMNAGINIYNAPMLNQESIKNALLVYPPVGEQQAIASFLDRETARIDALIQKKERMIELLKEKRIALITQAVTKGLDPNVPMKDSGIEWLGEVPEHWKVKKVKQVISFHTGWTPPSGNEEFYDGDCPWANISDLGKKYLDTPTKTITQEAVNTFRMKLSKKGSLLFSFKLSIGLVSLLQRDIYTNEAIATFPLDDRISTLFLYYLAPIAIPMNSGVNIYNAPMLNQESIKNALLVYPPIEEQQSIAAFLERETARLEDLISKINDSIRLLREYRASLIHHTVTGKIDLRGYDVQAQ